MIVWGGQDPALSDTGARYDPSTDTWMATSVQTGVPAARNAHSAVWSGTEMIVWGGGGAPHPTNVFDSGGIYDPATDAWVPTADGAGLPTARREATAVWTGKEVIVWGGFPYTSSGGRYCRSECFAPGLPPETVETIGAAKSGATIELSWTAIEAAAVYDVLRGEAGNWPVGSDPAAETCFADLSGTSFSDDALPAAGAGWWYLVRGANGCGYGSWGWQESYGLPAVERISSTCP